MNRTTVALLTRVRSSKANGYRTLHFTTPGGSGRGNSRTTFIRAEHVPEFEGEYGWFELERVKAVPWSYWQAVRQVEPPPGWKPPEPVMLTPAQLLGHR